MNLLSCCCIMATALVRGGGGHTSGFILLVFYHVYKNSSLWRNTVKISNKYFFSKKLNNVHIFYIHCLLVHAPLKMLFVELENHH